MVQLLISEEPVIHMCGKLNCDNHIAAVREWKIISSVSDSKGLLDVITKYILATVNPAFEKADLVKLQPHWGFSSRSPWLLHVPEEFMQSCHRQTLEMPEEDHTTYFSTQSSQLPFSFFRRDASKDCY